MAENEEKANRTELTKLQDELTDLRIKLEQMIGSHTTTTEKIVSLKTDIERIEGQIERVTEHITKLREDVTEDVATVKENVKRDLQKLYELIKREFVNKDTFDPIKLVVNGLVFIILASVAYALVAVAVHIPPELTVKK